MTSPPTSGPIHATAVALFCPDGWRGALLSGPSGTGKSDLALRLVASGWRLIGDDYVHVWASGVRLYAAPVQTIAGRIEARGLGILTLPHRLSSRIFLVSDCGHERVERLPAAQFTTIAGIRLPRLDIDVRPASAVETLTRAIRRL